MLYFSGMKNLKTFEELQQNVLDWADQRDLLKRENAFKQYSKFQEEATELWDAMSIENDEEIEDGLGDTVVTLIILGDQLGYNLVECLETAYNVIAKRTGKTVNGIFIKD